MKAVGSFPIWLPSLDTRSHAGEWPLEVVRIGESEKGNPLWDLSTLRFFKRWAAERVFAGAEGCRWDEKIMCMCILFLYLYIYI